MNVGFPKISKRVSSLLFSVNRVYGRGDADNGEGILSSLLILKHLDQSRMKYNLGLVFVADEETGRWRY